jgi:hypothetical protein
VNGEDDDEVRLTFWIWDDEYYREFVAFWILLFLLEGIKQGFHSNLKIT